MFALGIPVSKTHQLAGEVIQGAPSIRNLAWRAIYFLVEGIGG